MMLTRFEIVFVYIAIFVFPAPRCAALITMDMMLNIMQPMIIRKYSTAMSCVSSAEPHSLMIVSASPAKTMLSTIPAMTVRNSAFINVSFAFF